MQAPAAPVETDILLVGAGHAHVQVMRAFGMDPLPGCRITIVTDRLESPYSGMLPGCIAGDFPPGAMLIDIARLARATHCRLIKAEAIGIDRPGRRLLLRDRPPLPYDLLSFDVGITPDLTGIEGASEHAIPVKPIAGFLRRLRESEAALGHAPRRVAVIGGGPAGIELAFAFRDRWPEAAVTLVAGRALAPSLPGSALKRIRRRLEARGIALVERDPAAGIEPGAVLLASGLSMPADAIFVSTAAKPAAWLTETDLPKAGTAASPSAQPCRRWTMTGSSRPATAPRCWRPPPARRGLRRAAGANPRRQSQGSGGGWQAPGLSPSDAVPRHPPDRARWSDRDPRPPARGRRPMGPALEGPH